TVSDNRNGTYTATLTADTTSGTATLSGTVNTLPITEAATVTFTPGAASGATTTIAATPSAITADGAATATVTVTVRDAHGNLRTAGGDTVALITTLGTLSTVSDNRNGTYTATLTADTTSGTATLSGTVNTLPITEAATVTFTPGAASASQTTATVPDGTAGQLTTITVQARDEFGNDLTLGGDIVVVMITGTNPDTLSATDNDDGTYTANYTPSLPGIDAITITLNGREISGNPYTSTVAPADDAMTTTDHTLTLTAAATAPVRRAVLRQPSPSATTPQLTGGNATYWWER
ncbi:MAG TPA: invasin domain 3-containing protein, partial [Gemmatimonadales bacterium]|nr:invasin domain 3-containing protein [Gemmatimonadales bacterium]